MKIFLKGFCIGLLCLSLLGLLWFLVLQPGLTNGEAQTLKKEYAQPLPGAESSGVLPAGKEQLEPESLVDLPALQAEYPDIKGWISIPGTCVDYPVLQSGADDPEYYLRRTYKGEWRTAGSIFFQWDCSAESQNTVVYGRNMNDGTMFAVLQKMADEAFRNEHSKILLQTSDGLREYQIAAVLKTDITKLQFNRTDICGSCGFSVFSERTLRTVIIRIPNHPRRGLPPADARHLFLRMGKRPHGGRRRRSEVRINQWNQKQLF